MNLALVIAATLASPVLATADSSVAAELARAAMRQFDAERVLGERIVVAPPAVSSAPPATKCFNSGRVAVPFASAKATELKDLILWAMRFSCKNFTFDPRVTLSAKTVTIVAPSEMSGADAYNLFLASLDAMGLTVVPKGNMFRIVSLEPRPSCLKALAVYGKSRAC